MERERKTKSKETQSQTEVGAVRCGAVRCGAVRCGAVRCGAVRCGVHIRKLQIVDHAIDVLARQLGRVDVVDIVGLAVEIGGLRLLLLVLLLGALELLHLSLLRVVLRLGAEHCGVGQNKPVSFAFVCMHI